MNQQFHNKRQSLTVLPVKKPTRVGDGYQEAGTDTAFQRD